MKNYENASSVDQDIISIMKGFIKFINKPRISECIHEGIQIRCLHKTNPKHSKSIGCRATYFTKEQKIMDTKKLSTYFKVKWKPFS